MPETGLASYLSKYKYFNLGSTAMPNLGSTKLGLLPKKSKVRNYYKVNK